MSDTAQAHGRRLFLGCQGSPGYTAYPGWSEVPRIMYVGGVRGVVVTTGAGLSVPRLLGYGGA